MASRLSQILESDKIMVMDGGKVVEFDTPVNLLDTPNTMFASLVSQAGDIDPSRLREVAAEKALRASQTTMGKNGTGTKSRSKSTATSKQSSKVDLGSGRGGGSQGNVATTKTQQQNEPNNANGTTLERSAASLIPKSLEGLFTGGNKDGKKEGEENGKEKEVVIAKEEEAKKE